MQHKMIRYKTGTENFKSFLLNYKGIMQTKTNMPNKPLFLHFE